MNKKDLLDAIFAQGSDQMAKNGFIRKKGQLYYKPVEGRFLFTVSIDVINHGSCEEFDIDPVLGVTNMNVNFLRSRIDENYIYANNIFLSGFISNVGQIAQGGYKDWHFSINSNVNLNVAEEMFEFVLKTYEGFYSKVNTADKFISYAVDTYSIKGVTQALLMYYCCNRRDLGLNYIEFLRGERLERLLKNWNREKFERFLSRYENELPEDSTELLQLVPAFCKKRRITIID